MNLGRIEIMKIVQSMGLALIVAGLTAGSSTFAHAGAAYDELRPDQQKTVQNGEQVVVTKDDLSSPWPKVYIYQRVEATPEEATAIFTDYELQKSYVPDMLKSHISKKVDKATTEIDYIVHLPRPFPDETYSVVDHVAAYDNGASYKVGWKMLRSDSMSKIEGTARFERLGTGTILAYYNFGIPTSHAAGLAKNKALRKLAETVAAMVNQMQNERKQNQDLLQKQIQALHQAVAP